MTTPTKFVVLPGPTATSFESAIPESLTDRRLLDALSAPFSDADVKAKVQTKPNAKGNSLVVVYVDARVVVARLNEVFGLRWSVEHRHAAMGNGVEAQITVGDITRSDVGTVGDGDLNPEKSAYSDAVKRAAVGFGVGAYLYRFPTIFAPAEGKSPRLTKEAAADIRGMIAAIHRGHDKLPSFASGVYVPDYFGSILPDAVCTTGDCTAVVTGTVAQATRKFVGRPVCKTHFDELRNGSDVAPTRSTPDSLDDATPEDGAKALVKSVDAAERKSP